METKKHGVQMHLNPDGIHVEEGPTPVPRVRVGAIKPTAAKHVLAPSREREREDETCPATQG